MEGKGKKYYNMMAKVSDTLKQANAGITKEFKKQTAIKSEINQLKIKMDSEKALKSQSARKSQGSTRQEQEVDWALAKNRDKNMIKLDQQSENERQINDLLLKQTRLDKQLLEISSKLQLTETQKSI